MKYRGKVVLQFHPISGQTSFEIPLMNSAVAAGFPSPAEDHLDLPIDLNKYLVKNPAATFYVRVDGDSMDEAGTYTRVDSANSSSRNSSVRLCFSRSFKPL